MHVRVLAAAAVALAVASPAARAATVMPATVQATCLSDCFDRTHTYSQVIAAANFSGPVSVGGFSFSRALLGEEFQTSVFHVTFWTADGQKLGDFGRYMVGSLGGDKLTLRGQSFVYDPSLGNLTMKVELDGFSSGVGGGGFGAGAADEVLTRGRGPGDFTPPGLIDNPGLGGVTPPGIVDNPGLKAVTQPVPEPGAWAMMLLGFGGAGVLLRSRRPRTA